MYIVLNARIKRITCVCAFLSVILYLYVTRSNPIRIWHNENGVSLKALLAGAIGAAEAGGYQVLTVYKQSKLDIEIKGKTKEGVIDLVTAADYRSHCVMYHSLIEAFPEVTVISEETSKDCDKLDIPDLTETFLRLEDYDTGPDVFIDAKDITVWLDPLDATKEYTEDLLQYVSTMVCVAVNGKPVIGVIYKPFETRKNSNLYWAWTNHGSSTNLQNIPKPEPNRWPIVVVSRSHSGYNKNNRDDFMHGMDGMVIAAGGAGYKFLEVVLGNATAYLHLNEIKKWDICAGTAILSALGGKITQRRSKEPITFGPTDDKVLSTGFLATMINHQWYTDKLLFS